MTHVPEFAFNAFTHLVPYVYVSETLETLIWQALTLEDFSSHYPKIPLQQRVPLSHL